LNYSYKNKIISLEGVEKTGKTHVLNQVISMMIATPGVDQIDRFKDNKDKTYVFHIKDKLVFITTLGDDNRSLSEQLDSAQLAYEKKFDLIVYAKREDQIFSSIFKLMNNGYLAISSVKQSVGNVSEKTFFFKNKKKTVNTLKKDCIQMNNQSAIDVFELIKKYI
jgi:hypothetical protein